jgi:glycerol uptake facilitator-like aquaporin
MAYAKGGKFGNATMPIFSPQGGKKERKSNMRVGDAWAIDGGPNSNGGDVGQSSNYGGRFRPPRLGLCLSGSKSNCQGLSKKFSGYLVRFWIATFLATLFFTLPVNLTQAFVYKNNYGPSNYTTPTDNQFMVMSLVRGVSLFVPVYLFWDYGHAQIDPAVTIAYWMLGHITLFQGGINLVLQMSAASISAWISYGFTGYGGGFFPNPNDDFHNGGFHFLWEMTGSVILISVIVWAISSDRLFKEGAGDTTMEPNHKTMAVPEEYLGNDRHISFSAAIVYGAAYFALSLAGFYVTGGAGGLNFWAWWGRILNVNYITGGNIGSTGVQVAVYLLGPITGGIIATILMSIMISLTRNCAYSQEIEDDDETASSTKNST